MLEKADLTVLFIAEFGPCSRRAPKEIRDPGF